MEQRRELELLTRLHVEMVDVPEAVEQGERQRGHVVRVRRIAAEPCQAVQHAAELHVLDAPEPRHLLRVRSEIVGDEPLAHAEVGERDRFRADLGQDVFEHDRSGDDDLRTPRVDPPQPLTLGVAHAAELAGQVPERLER